MSFLTESQQRVIGWALTGLALVALAGVALLVGGALIWLIRGLGAILIPMGIAGVLAYILFPVVAWLERRLKWRRTPAILIVFGFLALAALLILVFILPRVYEELFRLVRDFPAKLTVWQAQSSAWLRHYPELQEKLQAWQGEAVQKGPELSAWIGKWALASVGQILNAIGLVLGLIFIPLYTFYFLRDQALIEKSWKKYLPLHSSLWKEELVFILEEVNRYMIVFFRGQVLVALILGGLTTIGLSLIGLNYALLIGLFSGMLCIIPYLGVVTGLGIALLVALAQSGGGWGLAGMTVAVFGVVQMLEGFVISPKIMGERTGLHPMTVIVAILVWSQVLGGVLGAILAIPLTATLRVLMFRYIWK